MKPDTANSWQDVQNIVLSRIQSGAWKPGDSIPNEADLAKELGCARTTVNRALRELAAEGLLERRRKAGTRVAAFPTRRTRLHIPLIREEVEQSGAAYSYKLIRQERTHAPEEVITRLGYEGRNLLHVEALHFSDQRPRVHESRWINPAAVEGLRMANFDTCSPNEWLVQNAPFTAGTLSFSAEDAGEDVAAHLGTTAGAPLFVMERTTRTPTAPVTFVRLSYAPGYRMQMDL